ncbi:MAG: hypothetical protein AB1478_07185 [Nitrospirota bacterium]
MPWHRGRYIPFDADYIARLLYDGEEVLPDLDISPEQFERENNLVMDKLRALWRDQPFRVIESVHEKQFRSRWKEGETIVEPSRMGLFEIPYKKVIHNPFLRSSEMPLITPKTLKKRHSDST